MGSPTAHLGRIRGLSNFRAAKMGLSPSGRVASYDAVRIILALILLTAAALKGHQLATEPLAEAGLFTSRWFLIGVVEFELFFGLWLCCGLYPRRTWQATLACFGAFACVSVYKALSGEATCGCFGRVPVNPWYTLILDVAALMGLFCCRPARAKTISPLPPAGEGPGVRAFPCRFPFAAERPGVRGRLGFVFGLFMAAGLPGGLAMATYRPATLADSGDIFGQSAFVVLEPEKWVGKRFPLLDYIDIGDQLAEGEWIVFVYDPGCPHCQDELPEYERLADRLETRARSTSVAFVATARYAVSHEPFTARTAPVTAGRLKHERRWFLRVPLEVLLDGGVVTRARKPIHQWEGSGTDPNVFTSSL